LVGHSEINEWVPWKVLNCIIYLLPTTDVVWYRGKPQIIK
jgi:hypothetical protein